MAENAVEKWVWLTTLPKIDSRKVTYLLDKLNDIHAIYAGTSSQYDLVEGLTAEDKKRLLDKDRTHAKRIVDYCQNFGAHVVTYDDENYPDILRKIYDPPYVLYTKGNLSICDEQLSIGIVGARVPTEYGKKAAYDLSFSLARQGVTIVSGMAHGLDGMAHRGALKAGGTTIAVLGSGIDVVYLPEHDKLEEAIMSCGLVLTEYPPGTPPHGANFPKRNRIISGLSQGVVVVEASKKSGSLITAATALNQDRDVFAIPGSIYSGNSIGTNRLIAQGAKLVQSAEDVLDEYRYAQRKWKTATIESIEEPPQDVSVPITNKTIADPMFEKLDPTAKQIVSCILEGIANGEKIAEKLEIPISKVLATLTMLEIEGVVKSRSGKNYVINDNNR